MSENDVIKKIPISDKWRKKLDDGRAIAKAAKEGKINKIFYDFPKNMEIPENMFYFADEKETYDVIKTAVFYDNLSQLVTLAKEHNLDFTNLISKKDGSRNTHLHNSAGKGALGKYILFAKKLKLDITPLFKEKNNRGETFLHEVAKGGSELSIAYNTLKENKVDLKALFAEKDEEGNIFLHYAAYNQNFLQVASLVQDLDFDITPLFNEKNKKGETFVDFAGRRGLGKQAEKFKQEMLKFKISKKMQELSNKTEQYKALPINNIKNRKGSR